MPMRPEIVELIHTKLLLTYGPGFKALAAGVSPEVVRKHWAAELDGLSAEQVAWGLRSLPPNECPNVLQFRALCRPPERPAKLLRAPRALMPPAVKVKLEQAKAALTGADRFAWAHHLREREEKGERLTLVQRQAWRHALRVNRKEADHG